MQLTQEPAQRLQPGPRSRVLDVTSSQDTSALYGAETFGCQGVCIDLSGENVRIAQSARHNADSMIASRSFSMMQSVYHWVPPASLPSLRVRRDERNTTHATALQQVTYEEACAITPNSLTSDVLIDFRAGSASRLTTRFQTAMPTACPSRRPCTFPS